MAKKSRSKRKSAPAKSVPKAAAAEISIHMPQATALGERLSKPAPASVKAAADAHDYAYVRSDIGRIMIYMAVIAALLATAVVIDANTGFLTRAGAAAGRLFGLM